ncbi:LysR family transcriptional regulator [Streptomyces sp. Ru73]|uniref:LysR family transcriptional regulator n=1 Tax=Streptomyces sp. Ru73 TaxID=2080748 RepID=UPI000CDD5572|nr:LysR family transcriptional regulator [Streptomyces sp. Ru73]POX38736.1 LysR family transcriptional regulator [Streptomyces sp. Ru73]
MLFRQLEYLVALSRERHFARAAQSCYVSQPALSEAIRKLEEELDVPLIQRGRKYEGLTPEGERVVLWAQRILADRDALTSEVQALRTGLSGELRIGCVPTASAAVALLVEPFCAAHPLVEVRIASDLRSRDILGRLENFELDAGITYLSEEISDQFRTVPLYRERYVLLTGESHPAAAEPTVSWATAAALPLCLLSTGMQGRRVLDEVFAEAGVRAAPQVETDSIASVYAHVRTGRWAGIVPRAWLRVFDMPPGMRAVPLVEPVRTAAIGLVLTAREPGSVMARALTDVARRTDMARMLEHLPGERPAED